jgi:phosphoglucosamine mutase
VAQVPEYPIRRDSVEVAEKSAVMDRVATLAADRHPDRETLDGVRVDLDDGWFLVRASGTQPLVRLTAEARDEAGAATAMDAARSLLADARER